MSKKNSRAIRQRHHQADLQREREEKERRQKEQEKKQAKVVTKGVEKKIKKKGFRIRKGVVIKGIKVQDAETKRKVIRALQKEALMKTMETDEAAQPKAAVKTPGGLNLVKGQGADKKRVVVAGMGRRDKKKAAASSREQAKVEAALRTKKSKQKEAKQAGGGGEEAMATD